MTAPNSKAKRPLRERQKRRLDQKIQKRRELAEERAQGRLDPPRVRLPGAEIESAMVACCEGAHPMHVIRKDHAVKAIITPCGIAGSRAVWNLGNDSCWKFIALALGMIADRPVFPPDELPSNTRALTDETGQILKLVGDSWALRTHKKLRQQREERRWGLTFEADPKSRAVKHGHWWDRTELTIAVLPKLVAQLAGPGYEVWFHSSRCYVQAPGQEGASCYVYDTGSWSAGPGPQGPDSVYLGLKRWATFVANHAARGEKRGVVMRTPGFRPF